MLIWWFGDHIKIAKLTYAIIDPFLLQAWVFLHTIMTTANSKSHQQCFLSKPPNIMFTYTSAYTVFHNTSYLHTIIGRSQRHQSSEASNKLQGG